MEQSFIVDTKKLKDFHSKSCRVDRTVTEITLNSDDNESPNEKVELLGRFKKELNDLRTSRNPNKKGFYDIRCFNIQVEKDDGMTWSAEMINNYIQKQTHEFQAKTFCIKP